MKSKNVGISFLKESVFQMNKSMKQISEELGVDKQQVYRFINKENIKEVHQSGQTKLYDETAQKHIALHFKEKTVSSKYNSETAQAILIKTLETQIEALKKANNQLEKDKAWLQEQIEVKDGQIKSWEGAAAQFSQQQPVLLNEDNQKAKKMSFLERLFGRRTSEDE